MKNKIFFLLLFAVLSNSSSFSLDKDLDDNRVKETQQNLVNSHVEYAKACIDKQYQKTKEKIRKFEDELHHIEKYREEEKYMSDQVNLDERRIKLINKIKKYEEKLENYRSMKLSLDIIDFNSL